MNIVCEENLSASQIAILKKAIKDKGYKISNTQIIDNEFNTVLLKLQRDNKLAIGGITSETLKFLGVQ